MTVMLRNDVGGGKTVRLRALMIARRWPKAPGSESHNVVRSWNHWQEKSTGTLSVS